MVHDSYFTVEVFTNHILAENTYFTNRMGWIEHKIMVLTLANKCQNIPPCHNFKNIVFDYFYHHASLHGAKSFVNIFRELNTNKTIKKDETISNSKINLPFDLLWR